MHWKGGKEAKEKARNDWLKKNEKKEKTPQDFLNEKEKSRACHDCDLPLLFKMDKKWYCSECQDVLQYLKSIK